MNLEQYKEEYLWLAEQLRDGKLTIAEYEKAKYEHGKNYKNLIE